MWDFWHCGYAQIPSRTHCEELDLEDDENYPEQPRGYFLVQMDKSTCQSYNHATNLFNYNGVPTKRTQLLLEDIAVFHGVFIMAVCQPTHCFDVNGCDADGNIDKSLIPQSILDWYSDEETSSESES